MAPFFKSSNRLETFSDGVFAIAITLLVLEIRVPQVGEHAGPAALWAGLGQLWPSYLAYALAFSTILIAWIGHHAVLAQVEQVSLKLLFINGFFLLSISFLPFPTSVVAEYLRSESASAAAVFYALANLLASLVHRSLVLVILADQPQSVTAHRTPRYQAQVHVGRRVVPDLCGAGPAEPAGFLRGGRGDVGLVGHPTVRASI